MAIKYIDEYGLTQEVTTYTVVSSTDTEWTAGFYVVESNTVINNSVTVTGDVKLILADGVSLTVNASATAGKAGICVTNDATKAATNFFTVYGQTAGSGQLIATGGSAGAGIGGGLGEPGSHITLAGGTVVANGGTGAAGIGGGYSVYNGTSKTTLVHGTDIKVTGGTVIARGIGGAGIGGGGQTVDDKTNGGKGERITITGGVVDARSAVYDSELKKSGAGIGGGYGSEGNGKIIKISGGKVIADGGTRGAGIGGGGYGNGTGIEITGGSVTATSIVGSAIGGGYSRTTSGNTVYVNTEVALQAGASQEKAEEIAHTTGTDIASFLSGMTYAATQGNTVTVDFVDENGKTQTLNGNFTLVTGGASAVDWTEGYYVVGADYNNDGVINAADATYAKKHSLDYEFTITGGATVSGNVRLILVDGFTLTVDASATDGAAGIRVHNDTLDNPTNFFTVYGQSNGSGILTAQGGTSGAGIGGAEGESGSEITIAGGTVNASAHLSKGYLASGIGGGGDPTPTSASVKNAGEARNITITGGVVTAVSGNGGAGIGGKNASNITISGGTVSAIGKSGAGIGGCMESKGSQITISGGVVFAGGTNYGGNTYYGAGIGGGHKAASYDITISGGTVVATGVQGAAIGGGKQSVAYGTTGHNAIDITGGVVIAQTSLSGTTQAGSAIGAGAYYGSLVNGTIVINASEQLLTGADEESAVRIAHTSTENVASSLAGKEYAAISPIPVSYVDEYGETKTLTGNYTIIADSDSAVEWTEGYYVVGADYNNDGVINAADATYAKENSLDTEFTITGGATVSGNVKLILVDGFSLTVNATATDGAAGIRVHNDDLDNPTNFFTVYGQSNGTGILTAKGGTSGAGIGGAEGESGSEITIAGGTVNASAHLSKGYMASGIGGGGDPTPTSASVKNAGEARNIKITGGVVNAESGSGGAGIGGKNASNITISGGTVSAIGKSGAGIGGCMESKGSQITISGGVVFAGGTNYGGNTYYGAGIGGGHKAASYDITISGGTVVATGVQGAAIGGGKQSVAYGTTGHNAIDITGGVVIAQTSLSGTTQAGSAIGAGAYYGSLKNGTIEVPTDWVLKGGTSSATAEEMSHDNLKTALIGLQYVSVQFETVTVASGTTTGTTANQTYKAASGEAFNVATGGTLTIAKGTTFSGNTTAIVNAGTVSITGAFALDEENDTISNSGTLNWDISAGSATNLDFSISDWSKVSGDGAQTLTVSDTQYCGTYALADNADKTFTVTVGSSTLNVGDGVTVGSKFYELLLDEANTASIRVYDEKALEESTVTCCAGTATRITGGTADKMFFGGTISSTGGTAAITSDGTVSIGSGTFGNSIACGSASKSSTQLEQTGNLDFTIEGGTFAGRVAGGMYVADGAESTTPSTAAATLVGNVKLTIKGGTFNGRIYGGCNAQKDAYGVQSTIEGSVSVTVDSSKNVIAINNYLIGGSRGGYDKQTGKSTSGTITGDVTVTFTGFGSNSEYVAAGKGLTFNGGTSVVAGGCNGDYVKIDAEGERTITTGVKGSRNLVFDDFDGNFGADLRLFSTATFKNGTDVAFTDTRVNLWTIETWNFEFGSSFSGLRANDFESDTLNFDVTGLTTESDWTVGSGAVAAFDDLADATAVYFGSSAATYVEENACWTDGTYKLALKEEGTVMFVSKIA